MGTWKNTDIPSPKQDNNTTASLLSSEQNHLDEQKCLWVACEFGSQLWHLWKGRKHGAFTLRMWTLLCRFSEIITCYLNANAIDFIPRVELGQHIIISKVPHLSWLLHGHDKITNSVFILLTQEIKRDMLYRRMNLPPSAQQLMAPQKLTAL